MCQLDREYEGFVAVHSVSYRPIGLLREQRGEGGTFCIGSPKGKSKLTTKEFATRYGCGVHKVLDFIASGELVAINMASAKANKPRWMILQEEVEAFLRRKSSGATVSPRRPRLTRRRQKKDLNVTEWY
jgi:Helix-turn-helix domain